MTPTQLGAAVVAIALAAAVPAAVSQEYPNRPVRLIVPFGPGGTPDIVARVFADNLSLRVGQPVIVENRPGGDSIIGFDAVAKAAPDGYTILFNTYTGIALLPHTRKSLPFDPTNHFVHVAQLVYSQFVFAVNSSLPVSDIAAMITLSRSKPNNLSYAAASEGAYVTAEMFKLATGADLLHVPYKTAVQGTTDLLAGRIDMLVATPGATIPHFKSGKLKPLAVSGERRSPVLPDVPTIRESGVRGFDSSVVWGLSAPAATSAAIVRRLDAEAAAVMKTPAVTQRMLVAGVEPYYGRGDDYAALLRAESEKWRGVLQRIQFKPE